VSGCEWRSGVPRVGVKGLTALGVLRGLCGVLGAAGKFLCNCAGVCGKRRVDVRCVVVDHLQVVIGDVVESECSRMDRASSFKSGRL
jgi:hypothetical protein